MEQEIDAFLPFWWISKHPPQGAWKSEEISFNSPSCLETCIKFEQAKFSLTWDEAVCKDPAARIVGYVSAAQDDKKQQVPAEFHPYLDIMGKGLADVLLKHSTYDCKINLKPGATALWGPIYPLSEAELQALREWLKEMEKMGKIH